MEGGGEGWYTFYMNKALVAVGRNPLLVASIVFGVVVAVALPMQRAWEREVLVTMDQDAVIDYYRTEEGLARHLKNLEAAYRADTYGSTTPEGTLELFREALEAGDIELASKYFLVEEQDDYKTQLMQAYRDGVVDSYLAKTESLVKSEYSVNFPNKVYFYVTEDDEVVYTLDMVKNPLTEIWKIERI